MIKLKVCVALLRGDLRWNILLGSYFLSILILDVGVSVVDSTDFIFLLLGVWVLGVTASNVYLSNVLDGEQSLKDYSIHFASDVLVSAIGGLITYFLASPIGLPTLYMAMISAVIGHMFARVIYKALLVDIQTKRVAELLEIDPNHKLLE